MRKIIAAINITLDGFCDHTAVSADDSLHDHYTELLRSADTILYGRITYGLMEFWPGLLKNPSGEKSLDDFAIAMNNISKVVFSRTLKDLEWETARLATRDLKDEVLYLRQQPGKDILVGSPGLINSLTQLGLIDEYQLCIHPVIAGKGLPLFKNIEDSITLIFLKSKTLHSGATVLYYESVKNEKAG